MPKPARDGQTVPLDRQVLVRQHENRLSEPQNQFSFTYLASITGCAAKDQIPISYRGIADLLLVMAGLALGRRGYGADVVIQPSQNFQTIEGWGSGSGYVGGDPENNTVSGQWSLMSQPSGGSATVGSTSYLAVSLRATVTGVTVPGDYIFQIVMGDPSHPNGVTNQIICTIHPASVAPVIASVSASQATLTLPTSANALSSVTTYTNSDILRYWWVVRAPAGRRLLAALGAGGAAQAIIPDFGKAFAQDLPLELLGGKVCPARLISELMEAGCG